VTIRRPGGRWRLLVHDYVGRQPDGTCYSNSHHVTSEPNPPPDEHGELNGRPFEVTHVSYPDAEFDELVVGRWLHVEQMDGKRWWMNVGGVTLWVTVDRDGNPKHVTTYPAGTYAYRVDGCTYDDEGAA
jgi:hypothetical protein